MKVFLEYLKDKRGTLCLGLGTAAIFLTVGSLYRVPADALEYSCILAAVLWGIVLAVGFWRYAGEHRKLEKILESPLPTPEDFPETYGLLEEDYCKIIQKLENLRKELSERTALSMKDMSEYYGMWVHQIKTPIAAMHLLLQSMEDRRPEETGIRELKGELFKTEQYVEMVLTYLRTEELSGDLDFGSFELDACIRKVIRKYANLFILQKIQLDFRETNRRVLTDEKWIGFVLEQIFSNALKYTEPGGRISVYEIGQGEQAMLVIEDMGIGIQAEDIPRIFEKGFTGYNGRNSRKSTGIGLFLVKKIMDRLGHEIYIQSQPGKGTKVLLNLNHAEYLTKM